jgi:hypothetical protein
MRAQVTIDLAEMAPTISAAGILVPAALVFYSVIKFIKPKTLIRCYQKY